MKNLIKITTLSLLASSSILANNVSIDSIGLNLGKSYSDYKQKNNQGTIILGNEPDKSFNLFEIYTTLNPITNICKKYNMKPYLSYSYSKNDDLKYQYFLLGLNKYYRYKKVELYAGVLGGYGELDWRYDPLNRSQSKNEDANSFIGGIQLGFDYPISKKISLGINGKYLFHNYEVDLKPSSNTGATIKHDRTSSIGFGIKYSF